MLPSQLSHTSHQRFLRHRAIDHAADAVLVGDPDLGLGRQRGRRHRQAAVVEDRMRHAAHALATVLVAGEACPVCRQRVEGVPELESPAETSEIEAGVAAAEKKTAAARTGFAEARDGWTRLDAERSNVVFVMM